MRQAVTLLKSLARDRDVATVLPTSRNAVKKICERVHTKAKIVVEYGPGTGVISMELLSMLPKDAKLILIEKNPDLATFLRSELSDERVFLFCDSAENVGDILSSCGMLYADCVISGIPFSRLSLKKTQNILQSTRGALVDDGVFLVYQFLPVVRRELCAVFPNVRVAYLPRNVPPLFLFEARK